MAAPILAAGVAVAPAGPGDAEAALPRAVRICGGAEYKLIHVDRFRTGRAAVTKHRNSRTYCAVTFNTTGKVRRTKIALRYKKGGRWHRSKDVGRYGSYAGPVYLGRPKGHVHMWYVAFVGKNDIDDVHGVAGFCHRKRCNNESGGG